MTEKVVEKKSFLKDHRFEIVGLATTAVTVGSASAAGLNASVGGILDEVILLVPTIVALVVAIVPALITLGVISFVLGFFDAILAKIKI
jgi:hypothetical protein